MRRTGLAVAILAMTLLVRGAAPAAACSCAAPDGPIEDRVTRADGAFVGTVTDIGKAPPFSASAQEVPHRFTVESVAAGEIGPEVVVQAATVGASCGLELQVGQRAGLFVSRIEDRWIGSLCARADADELAAVGHPPDPSIPIPDDGGVAGVFDSVVGDGDDGGVLLVIAAVTAAGALGLAVIGIALVRSRARARNDPAPS